MKVIIANQRKVKIKFKKAKKMLDKNLIYHSVNELDPSEENTRLLKRTKAIAIEGYSVSGYDRIELKIKNFIEINGQLKKGYTVYGVQCRLSSEVYEFEFKTWKETKDYINQIFFTTELFA